MGKTRLARQIMAEAAEGEWGERLFCSLVSCETLPDLEAAIARALGLTLGGGSLRERELAIKGPILLILDNLDALASAAGPTLDSLLAELPDLQLLVTSLGPTGVPDEVRFELGPLEPDDAEALYRDRSARSWADRRPAPDDARTIGELVHRLDRIPLAIELAAARARILPPRTLLSRIDGRLELLRTDRPGRHGSLEQALSITWELLEPPEQLAMARSSVFAGGFSIDAAAAVLGEGRETDTWRFLDSLRNLSFLQVDDRDPPRFFAYESVQAFAARQLARLGELESSIDRHRRFFLEQASAHAEEMQGPGAPEAIRWLRVERENLLAALRRGSERDPVSAARIGVALAAVLHLEGVTSSEFEILAEVVSAARRAGSPSLIIQALRSRAEAFARRGRPAAAREDLEEALELAAGMESRLEEGFVRSELGRLHAEAGEPQRAEEEEERALEIARALGNPDLEALALLGLGLAAKAKADLVGAHRAFEDSLQVSRRHGRLLWEGRAHFNLGTIHAELGRFREAREALQEAQRCFRRVGNRTGEAYTLFNLGAIEFTVGRLEEAERYSQAAFQLEGADSHLTFVGQGLSTLGLIAFERGEIKSAEQQLAESAAIIAKTGDRARLHQILPFLAGAQALLGRLSEARRALDEVRAHFEEIGDRESLEGLELFEGFLEIAQARGHLFEGKKLERTELEQRARERLLCEKGGDRRLVVEGRRLLQRAISRAEAAPDEELDLQLTVGPEATWFQLEGGAQVELRRRATLRRILSRLVEQRLAAPGIGLDLRELFAAGWPNQSIGEESAGRRVYTAIWTLRSLGLEKVLLHGEDGYCLDPTTTVELT